MRRGLAVTVVLLVISNAALAQASRPAGPPVRAGAARPSPDTLKGEKRARFIMRQLDLTEEQKSHATGLIELYYKAPPAPDLVKLQVLISEGQKIEAEKKTEKDAQKLALLDAKLAEINEEIRKMGQNDGNEEEFLLNLRSVLTEPQKARLDETLRRLASNPSGDLRIADVIQFVQTLKLTDEQKPKLAALLTTMYEAANSQGNLDEIKRYNLLKKLIDELPAVLDAEQMKSVSAMSAAGLAAAKDKAEIAAATATTKPAPPRPGPQPVPAPAKP